MRQMIDDITTARRWIEDVMTAGCTERIMERGAEMAGRLYNAERRFISLIEAGRQDGAEEMRENCAAICDQHLQLSLANKIRALGKEGEKTCNGNI